MDIAIIGAGLSGLTAARVLAQAGHHVTVFEKQAVAGGRLATRQSERGLTAPIDHGAPFITEKGGDFGDFIEELAGQSILKFWTDKTARYANGKIYPEDPSGESVKRYTAPQGMSHICRFLMRWPDVYFQEKVSGITHVGDSRKHKGSWILNTPSINVFEADAVVIALPAVEAYGLVSTAQDELSARKMIAKLDDISYDPCYTLIAGFETESLPEWNHMICDHPVIASISNESSKRSTGNHCWITIRTTSGFAREHRDNNNFQQIIKQVLSAFLQIDPLGKSTPHYTDLHYWNYQKSAKRLEGFFMESEDPHAPLALVGDYFQAGSGDVSSLQSAYLSGRALARHWSETFS